ncbi:NADAR family protein [Bradyrhizobium liaoningense]|uniref:NADAR family protein n=1 Tax=Bradyrhizobium liaoningense TaxID=43992 RepID=UPI001BA9E365|nr:NADAR family protein [Bradyrhizobium liaoningense]MBR0706217.1 NADAR family protein [Bradyrhizobium liaoningense]
MARQTKKKLTETSAKNDTAADDAIRFYRANEKPYGPFSNLYRRPVEFDGVLYPTSEHAYQAGKALKPAVRDWILAAPTPALAAMAAHGLYTWDIVPDWSKVKFDRMRRVLKAKFEQHPDLAELLLSTGSKRLVEAGTVNNAVNRLWGEVAGNGMNMLGVMLMEIRDELKKGSASRAISSPRAPSQRKGARKDRISRPPAASKRKKAKRA